MILLTVALALPAAAQQPDDLQVVSPKPNTLELPEPSGDTRAEVDLSNPMTPGTVFRQGDEYVGTWHVTTGDFRDETLPMFTLVVVEWDGSALKVRYEDGPEATATIGGTPAKLQFTVDGVAVDARLSAHWRAADDPISGLKVAIGNRDVQVWERRTLSPWAKAWYENNGGIDTSVFDAMRWAGQYRVHGDSHVADDDDNVRLTVLVSPDGAAELVGPGRKGENATYTPSGDDTVMGPTVKRRRGQWKGTLALVEPDQQRAILWSDGTWWEQRSTVDPDQPAPLTALPGIWSDGDQGRLIYSRRGSLYAKPSYAGKEEALYVSEDGSIRRPVVGGEREGQLLRGDRILWDDGSTWMRRKAGRDQAALLFAQFVDDAGDVVGPTDTESDGQTDVAIEVGVAGQVRNVHVYNCRTSGGHLMFTHSTWRQGDSHPPWLNGFGAETAPLVIQEMVPTAADIQPFDITDELANGPLDFGPLTQGAGRTMRAHFAPTDGIRARNGQWCIAVESPNGTVSALPVGSLPAP